MPPSRTRSTTIAKMRTERESFGFAALAALSISISPEAAHWQDELVRGNNP
jgi:hypothetical protein